VHDVFSGERGHEARGVASHGVPASAGDVGAQMREFLKLCPAQAVAREHNGQSEQPVRKHKLTQERKGRRSTMERLGRGL